MSLWVVCSTSHNLSPDALSPRTLSLHALSPRALSNDGLSENVVLVKSSGASPACLLKDVRNPFLIDSH